MFQIFRLQTVSAHEAPVVRSIPPEGKLISVAVVLFRILSARNYSLVCTLKYLFVFTFVLQPLAIKPPKFDIQFAASIDIYITHSRGLFFSLLRMSWVGSDGEGVAVDRLNFQLEDITSVHQKFSTGCSLSKLSMSSNGKQ